MESKNRPRNSSSTRAFGNPWPVKAAQPIPGVTEMLHQRLESQLSFQYCFADHAGQFVRGKGGGGSGGASPVPAYQSSSFAVDDDVGSMTSLASLASRESQVGKISWMD